jgi:hypothetical protein
MPITLDKLAGARQPLPPVTITYFADGEERAETLRFHRRVLSPQFRRELEQKERAAKEAAKKKPKGEESKEEATAIAEFLVLLDVQSPDILGGDGAPMNLDLPFWLGCDDTLIYAVWQAHVEGLNGPKAQTPTTTNSGSLKLAS